MNLPYARCSKQYVNYMERNRTSYYCINNSGINNHNYVCNDENKSDELDIFDYMNLPEGRKLEEGSDSAVKYEDKYQ